jgi:hypothetical protein
MPWATIGYTASITGAEVTDGQLAQAQAVIDLYSNVTPAASGDQTLTARDRRLLAAAHAYQTVWMAAQVDVHTRTEVASLDQDGVRVVPGHEDALYLAPLARRALGRLSWMRSRSVAVRRPGDADPGASGSARGDTRTADRDGETWTPLLSAPATCVDITRGPRRPHPRRAYPSRARARSLRVPRRVTRTPCSRSSSRSPWVA